MEPVKEEQGRITASQAILRMSANSTNTWPGPIPDRCVQMLYGSLVAGAGAVAVAVAVAAGAAGAGAGAGDGLSLTVVGVVASAAGAVDAGAGGGEPEVSVTSAMVACDAEGRTF